MVEREVYIPDPESAAAFATCVQRHHYEADLECEHTRVDAGSLVGILAKCIEKKVRLVVYNLETGEELDEVLKQWY